MGKTHWPAAVAWEAFLNTHGDPAEWSKDGPGKLRPEMETRLRPNMEDHMYTVIWENSGHSAGDF